MYKQKQSFNSRPGSFDLSATGRRFALNFVLGESSSRHLRSPRFIGLGLRTPFQDYPRARVFRILLYTVSSATSFHRNNCQREREKEREKEREMFLLRWTFAITLAGLLKLHVCTRSVAMRVSLPAWSHETDPTISSLQEHTALLLCTQGRRADTWSSLINVSNNVARPCSVTGSVTGANTSQEFGYRACSSGVVRVARNFP